MLRCVLVAALGAALSCASAAQSSRPFPSNALRGVLVVTQPPEVLLNGKPARLSPGSRIRGLDNMQVLSGALIGQQLLVHYTGDGQGSVHMVWILTPDEAAKKPWPATLEQAAAWKFDPSAQAWVKP